MDPSSRTLEERWSEVDALFAEVLELPATARLDRLAQACRGDWELYEAVASLLRAAEQSEGMFEAPTEAALRGALEQAVGESGALPSPPERVGAYRIVRTLGRGGMGTVYLGERDGDDFVQRVAIKILRRGLDTDDVVRRFLVERRILASLAHPNIARLYDGGATADGRPYFVMEYVEGKPITRYCDDGRQTIAQRLALFLEVADAVRYAHANLVIHRDLKPSNILVTPAGRVMLLDFGIAKLLRDDGTAATELTHAGWRVLTPEYASPEQARGEPITTASDVYQLGLLLLRLLTGQRPRGRGATLREMERSFDEGETARPSALADADAAAMRSSTVERLRRQLRGDLDTIVQKALCTDAAMRYASVEELAGDVRRHVAGQPVSARPSTRRYRLRKFLIRNRWVAPTATIMLVFLAVYLGTLVRHAAQLERERNEAQLQAARAEEVQDFLIDLFRSPDMHTLAVPERGPRITVVEALDVGVERLRTSLHDRPRVRVELLDAIADVYESLSATQRALAVRREAIALHADLTGPASYGARKGLESVGRLLAAIGERDSALAVLQRRVALARTADDATPDELAEAYVNMAVYHLDAGDPQRALAWADTTLATAPPDEIPLTPRTEAYRVRAESLARLGRLEEAESAARLTYSIRRAAYGDSAASTLFAQVLLASTLSSMRRVDESRELFEEALPIMTVMLGDAHPLTLNSLNNLAVLYLNAGDASAAEALHRRLLEARRTASGEVSVDVAYSYQNLGTAIAFQGRLDEAATLHRRAAEIFSETLPPESYLHALPILSLADIALREGRAADAEGLATNAWDRLRATLPGSPATAVAECRVGRARMRTMGPDAAEAHLVEAARILEPAPNMPAYRAECLDALAELYERTGRPDSAMAVRARISEHADPG